MFYKGHVYNNTIYAPMPDQYSQEMTPRRSRLRVSRHPHISIAQSLVFESILQAVDLYIVLTLQGAGYSVKRYYVEC
jgi:hypothetical protein